MSSSSKWFAKIFVTYQKFLFYLASGGRYIQLTAKLFKQLDDPAMEENTNLKNSYKFKKKWHKITQ